MADFAEPQQEEDEEQQEENNDDKEYSKKYLKIIPVKNDYKIGTAGTWDIYQSSV